MKTKFRLVHASTIEEFENLVNELLEDEWSFHGPLIRDSGRWYQPMSKNVIEIKDVGRDIGRPRGPLFGFA